MDIVLILLRLLHIIAAFAWVGLGATMAFFVLPAALSAGETGSRFLKSLFTKTSFAKLFPMVAGITMLAGILLYVVGNSGSHFSRIGNMALGIGALAGIAAGIHGGAVTGRATKELGQSLAQFVPDGTQIIASDKMPLLRDQIVSLSSHSRISFVLMAVALIGMGIARYL
ncbi:MAG: hypothetical protein KF726_09880 [Anaerolineae bacterium]|nr:hypothetical protein [Anaerolineae bacterium]